MLISVARTVLLYLFIILAMRIMGKRQISDLQTSELVITLIISDIAAIPMQNTSQPLLSGFVPIIILIFIEVAISIIMMKSNKFRQVLCGAPVVVIKNGKVYKSEMKKLRLTIEDLSVQLRQQNIFSFQEVEYCIVETNGQISVLKKPEKRNPTASDMNIKIPDNGIETVVISDGKFLTHSLELCGQSKRWVEEKLKEKSIDMKDVFIMTADNSGKYNIIKGDN